MGRNIEPNVKVVGITVRSSTSKGGVLCIEVYMRAVG